VGTRTPQGVASVCPRVVCVREDNGPKAGEPWRHLRTDPGLRDVAVRGAVGMRLLGEGLFILCVVVRVEMPRRQLSGVAGATRQMMEATPGKMLVRRHGSFDSAFAVVGMRLRRGGNTTLRSVVLLYATR